MTPILSICNLSTGYGKRQVLFDVSLDVMPCEVVLITGANGSGKSTLLKAIYGMLSPWNADAKIVFRPNPDGPPLGTQTPAQNLANGLAYVPQKNAVFDDLTVEDNLRLSGDRLANRHTFAVRREEVLQRLPHLLSLLNHKSDRLSGGERQMVALGIALLHRPRLLLLDEPLTGLDSGSVRATVRWLESLSRTVSLVVVELRADAIASATQRILVMRLGSLQNDMESAKTVY